MDNSLKAREFLQYFRQGDKRCRYLLMKLMAVTGLSQQQVVARIQEIAQ